MARRRNHSDVTVPISASYFKIELVSFRAKHHPSLETVAWIPSGHAASAFTAATVLQRHYGLKTGIPAYAVAAYVAASRYTR